jgi:CubicO group peptidase (beta-lactamase class C family)
VALLRTFKYGGPSFQVAGAMVEAVTQRKWSDLFAERLATPLGMTHTYWTHLPDHGVPVAAVTNPLLQGGAVTTAEDYMRFLTMIDQHGLYQGKRILSEKAVDEMETAQTIGKPMAYVPPGVGGGVQYALGNWCEEWIAGGQCTLVSSPGAFGTLPWVDRKSDVYGIFFLKDRSQQILPHLLMARRLVLAGSAADAR